MNKRAKDWLRVVLLVPVVALSPIIILALVLVSILITGTISAEVKHHQMRSDIFAYVMENRDSIEITYPEYTEYFEYEDWGHIDSGVIYGYFYSPHDEYESRSRTYRNGYLMYGTPHSGEDWCYFEEICENWYYYEEHYG